MLCYGGTKGEIPMSAIKAYAENLTEKHGVYATSNAQWRDAARWTVLDCCSRLQAAALERSGNEAFGLLDAVDELHRFYDELKGVDSWRPSA